jgi:hypothetical protein
MTPALWPAYTTWHEPGCTLPHWRKGERLRWLLAAVRCNGQPPPRCARCGATGEWVQRAGCERCGTPAQDDKR